MKGNLFITHFMEKHGLAYSPSVEQESALLDAYLRASSYVASALGSIPEDILASDWTYGFLAGAYSRADGHARGSLACLLAGLPSSAEALARVAMEGSVVTIYCTVADGPENLISYINQGMKSNFAKLDKWEKHESRQEAGMHVVTRRAIEGRRRGLENLKSRLPHLLPNFPPEDQIRPWPSIRELFVAVRKEDEYLTVYARMCGEVHVDAENLWIRFAGSFLPDLGEKPEQEIVQFSRYMVHCALRNVLQAGAHLCVRYGHEDTARTALAGYQAITGLMDDMGNDIGSPV